MPSPTKEKTSTATDKPSPVKENHRPPREPTAPPTEPPLPPQPEILKDAILPETPPSWLKPGPSIVPFDSPLRKHPIPNLPTWLAATSPNGNPTGHPLSPEHQETFDREKLDLARQIKRGALTKDGLAELMRQRATAFLAAMHKNEEVDKEIEKLTKQRELERKLFYQMKEKREKKLAKKRGVEAGRGEKAEQEDEGKMGTRAVKQEIDGRGLGSDEA